MAKEDLSDLGGKVCVDDQNEKFIPALGNNAAKPGDLCYIDRDTGRVAPCRIGFTEFFAGILMESKITGPDAAIATDVPCKLVVPKSGHDYRIQINIATNTDEVGGGVTFSNVNYKAETTDTTLLLSFIGRIAIEVLVNDLVAEITWA